jgi:hypothetical protein
MLLQHIRYGGKDDMVMQQTSLRGNIPMLQRICVGGNRGHMQQTIVGGNR